MRLAILFAAASLLAGCEEEAPQPLEDTGSLPLTECAVPDAVSLDLAQRDGFGILVDGAAISYGTPPQGGAPYAPFRLRTAGFEDTRDGLTVDMVATDGDTGALLGEATYVHFVTCANVGDNAGHYVGGELHMRFPGFTLEELEGRPVEVTITVEDVFGANVDSSVTGVLTWQR